MKRLLIILPILSLLLAGCYKEPIANATINPNPALVGENITFTNLSTNTAYSDWDMGDGTNYSSFNAVHYYSQPGEYTVTLNSYGEKKGMSRASWVVEVSGPAASINPNPAWVGEDITFTNLSNNTAYSNWDMGDGTTYSSYDVIHYYIDPGQYTVTLSSDLENYGGNATSFIVDVTGSELKIIVKEYIDEYLIEEASVLLYASEDDWYEANVDKAIGGEQFTNSYGECMFEGLSSQKYYVDVYYRLGNDGYVNWLLGEEDIGWVETQEVTGGYDHTFIAYVDAVTFDDQKKSTGRPAVRPPLRDVSQMKGTGAGDRSPRENKFSTKIERK